MGTATADNQLSDSEFSEAVGSGDENAFYAGLEEDAAGELLAGAKTAPKTSAKKGGRLGNAKTRAQNSAIADKLEARGYEITGGGGRAKEEYLRPIGDGRKGGSYPDITAQKNGRTLRINTVDTRKSGAMTKREAENATRIRAQAYLIFKKSSTASAKDNKG